MKILTSTIFFCCLTLSGIQAQFSSVDLGVFAGMSFYSGEIDAAPWLTHVNPHPAGGILVRGRFTPHLSARFSLLAGYISDSDHRSTKPALYNRNLSFQSYLLESSLILEYNILSFLPAENKMVAPFLFGGIGLFRFNPQTRYQGRLVALQPLRTEGQGLPEYPDRQPYSLTQWSIPFGFGIKIAINQELTLIPEFGWRFANTDYLDDVSLTFVDPELLTAHYGELSAILSDKRLIHNPNADPEIDRVRGDNKTNDWYYFTGITLTYMVRSSDKGFFKMLASKSTKCPVF